jgi:O-antigen/teichoic acid export membrane protein
VTPPDNAEPPKPQMRGTHAGLIVFIGIGAANVGNYLFHLISARALGPASYADLAALVALAGLVALPLGGLQAAVARDVALLAAYGAEHAVAARIRRALLLAGIAGVCGTILCVAAATVVQRVLDIESLAAVVLAGVLTAPAFLTPIAWGWAQGLQRFVALSVSVAAGPVVRVVLVAILLAGGLSVAGAMTATVFAAATSVFIPLWLLRRFLAQPAEIPRLDVRRVVRRVVPVIAGLLAITALTTIDVVVAKSVLSEHEAGIYGAASLIGRVILYLPVAVATVLLPKVAARSTLRQASDDILAGSLAVTAAFCTIGTLVYALAPNFVVGLAFGSSFDDAAPLLWLFGLAMSGYSLLNVLLFYHLARGDRRFSWLLIAGAVVEAAAFVLFHSSARELIVVSAVTAALLLVAHDLLMGRELMRVVGMAPRLLRRSEDPAS